MSGSNVQYDEEFKRTLVDLYNNGRTQVSLCKEYGVSSSALARWIKRYSTVKMEDGQVLTGQQIKELQKRTLSSRRRILY